MVINNNMRNHSLRTLQAVLFSVLIFGACKKENDADVNSGDASLRPVTSNSSPYVAQLFEYLPAPGQLINTSGGNNEAATGLLGKKGLVSLGAWGGRIILGFDHTVINQAGKEDLLILGNASSNFAEPGVVYVMQDLNGNGKPDDTWYEISGSEYGKTGYKKDYSVTYTRPNPAGDVEWTDNMGNTGVVKTNEFHTQAYYPEWIQDHYTLTGVLLPSSNIDASVSSFIKSNPFEFGYADNTTGGDKIDIDDAVDKDGKKVSLKGIDFIKIQTGIQYNLGRLGELSTDLTAVADLSLYKD